MSMHHPPAYIVYHCLPLGLLMLGQTVTVMCWCAQLLGCRPGQSPARAGQKPKGGAVSVRQMQQLPDKDENVDEGVGQETVQNVAGETDAREVGFQRRRVKTAAAGGGRILPDIGMQSTGKKGRSATKAAGQGPNGVQGASAKASQTRRKVPQ